MGSNDSLSWNLPRSWLNQSTVLLLSEWQRYKLDSTESYAGVECLISMWLKYNVTRDQDTYCDATWDTLYCWPPAAAGLTLSVPCSEALEKSYPKEAPDLEGNAIRTCLENGTWSQGTRTNYDECATSFEINQKERQTQLRSARDVVNLVQNILFVGSIISLGCLCTALGIYYFCRSLRCDRVTINVHLMLALVIRSILLVAITEPFVFKRKTNYRQNNFICKTIIVAYLYGTLASVIWMFIQGLFLNMSVTTAVPMGVSTNRRFTVFYLLGWALPALLMITYVVSMVTVNQEQKWCWKGYSNMPQMWILIVPMLFALGFNLCFLLNIVRIVYLRAQRTRSQQGDFAQWRATVKATAVLFFVLGVNNLLVILSPGGKYENGFVLVNAFFGSTQGTVVSFLYCFCNKEVCAAIKTRYNRFWRNYSGGDIRNRRCQRRRLMLCGFAQAEEIQVGPDRNGNIPDFV